MLHEFEIGRGALVCEIRRQLAVGASLQARDERGDAGAAAGGVGAGGEGVVGERRRGGVGRNYTIK